MAWMTKPNITIYLFIGTCGNLAHLSNSGKQYNECKQNNVEDCLTVWLTVA